MSVAVQKRYLIDLSQVGNSMDIDVSNLSQATVRALDTETWGSGAVSLVQVFGGDSVAFETPPTPLSSAAPVVEGLKVPDALAIRAIVTTAGTGSGRISITGKEIV